MLKPNLIGIVGNIGSGKDTVAKMMQYYFGLKSEGNGFNKISYSLENHLKNPANLDEYFGWQIKKFAYKLKQIAAILVGCNANDFESQEFKDRILSHEWQIENPDKYFRTNRWLLQQLGTEAIRNNIHPETWINALFADYKQLELVGEECVADGKYHNTFLETTKPKFQNWIISDVRFLNEAKAIKDRGGVIIRIFRGELHNSEHQSEVELSKINYDLRIYNDGTIEELYEKVIKLLQKFGY